MSAESAPSGSSDTLPPLPLPVLSEASCAWLDDVQENPAQPWDEGAWTEFRQTLEQTIGPAILQNLERTLAAAVDRGIVEPQLAAKLEPLVAFFASASPLQIPIVRHLISDIYGLHDHAQAIWKALDGEATPHASHDDAFAIDRVAGEAFALNLAASSRPVLARWLIQEFYAAAPGRAQARRLAETHPELQGVAQRICEVQPDTTAQLLAWHEYVSNLAPPPPLPAKTLVDPRGRKIHPLHWVFLAVFLGLCGYRLFFVS